MNKNMRFLIILALIVLLSPLAVYAERPYSHYPGSRFRHDSYRSGRHYGGHFQAGVWIGAPLVGPYWDPYPYRYPYAYPYYPYPYYQAPSVIIEQPTEYYSQPAPRQPEAPSYWYYCRNPEGYYPYVKQCPDGWMKVLPTPPASGRER